jgi:hypothetical protein
MALRIMSYLFLVLQYILALGVVLPLFLVAKLLLLPSDVIFNVATWSDLFFFFALAKLLRAPGLLTLKVIHWINAGPYYWTVVQKRRCRGEPLWQEHDVLLGKRMP